jgi:hypothetical protein
MSDVSETAGELGISDDERSLAEGVLSNSQDELQVTQGLCELLLRSQYGAAYLIANQQVAGGVAHPGLFWPRRSVGCCTAMLRTRRRAEQPYIK